MRSKRANFKQINLPVFFGLSHLDKFSAYVGQKKLEIAMFLMTIIIIKFF